MESVLLTDWLDQLAAKQPTPGGGGVAALHSAVAAALIGMVTIYTTGPKWVDYEVRMQELHAEAADLRDQALALIEADARAFSQIGAAYSLAKNTPTEKQQRQAAIQTALIAAAEPPQQVVDLGLKLVIICQELVETSNPNVISDVAVAASTIQAALESAAVNIAINQASIKDSLKAKQLSEVIMKSQTGASEAKQIAQTIMEKLQKDRING